MALGTLDWVLAGTLALSALLGLWRGLVYEVLSVLGWVFAFLCAQTFAGDAGSRLPLPALSEPLQYAVGFSAVFIASAFAAGLVSWIAKRLVASVGLSPVDRGHAQGPGRGPIG